MKVHNKVMWGHHYRRTENLFNQVSNYIQVNKNITAKHNTRLNTLIVIQARYQSRVNYKLASSASAGQTRWRDPDKAPRRFIFSTDLTNRHKTFHYHLQSSLKHRSVIRADERIYKKKNQLPTAETKCPDTASCNSGGGTSEENPRLWVLTVNTPPKIPRDCIAWKHPWRIRKNRACVVWPNKCAR